MHPILQRLKERKLVQWALAYLAGAVALYQVLDAFGDPWGVGDGFLRVTQLLLAVGFLVTLVLAWYHGEQGRQRVSRAEIGMLVGVVVVGVSLVRLVPAPVPPLAVAEAESTVAVGALLSAVDSVARVMAVRLVQQRSAAVASPSATPTSTEFVQRGYELALFRSSDPPAVREALDQAETLARRVVASDPRDASGLALLAIVFTRRAEESASCSAARPCAAVDSARALADAALTLGPSQYLVQAAWGWSRDPLSNHPSPESIEALVTAVEQDPTFTRGMLNIGIWFSNEYRYDIHHRWLLRTAVYGGVPNLRQQLGYTHWILGDPQRALEYLRASVDLASNDRLRWGSLRRVVEVLLALGREDEARETMESSLRNHQDDQAQAGLIPLAGLVALLHEDYQAAGDYFRQALAMDPAVLLQWNTGITTLTHLSYALEKLGQSDEASQRLEEALAYSRSILDTEPEHAPYDLARIYAMRGELDEAKNWLRRAIDSGWPWVHTHMGPQDPLLENLYGDPEFQLMMSEISAELSVQRLLVQTVAAPPNDEAFAQMIEQARLDLARVRNGESLWITTTEGSGR